MMKRPAFALIALILALTGILTACAGSLPAETVKKTLPDTLPTTEKKSEEAAPTTEEKPEDPADDGILRILMVGNSFCYYYVDELYGMLRSVGIEAEVANLYHSGCKLSQHWNWYLDGEANYSLFFTDKNGRKEQKDATLKGALSRRNWDIVTLQQGFPPYVTINGLDSTWETCTPYAEKLINMFRKTVPQAKLYWNQGWVYEVGFNREGTGTMPDAETQNRYADIVKECCERICKELDLPMIPAGNAWYKARNEYPGIGRRLHVRSKDGGDYQHDGDIGGGQYLNAAVWFEILTGESVVGNTYRPNYTLPEETVGVLQNIAHDVAQAQRALESAAD